MTQKTKHIPKSLKIVLVYVLAILFEFTIVNAYLASAITVSSGQWSGAPSYSFWREASTYYAKNAYGQTLYPNSDAGETIQDAISSMPLSGGDLYFSADAFEGSTTITIPDEMHCLSFVGASGFGKSFAESGDQGTHFQWTASPIITNNYTDNTIHSISGIIFENIKFEGPNTNASIGLYFKNADLVEINKCTFFRLGTAFESVFADSTATYTLANQPGSVRIHDSIFSENLYCNIYLERCTDNFIGPNVFFYGWGSFERNIHLKGSQLTNIHDSVFQVPNPQTVTEHIYLEPIDATYVITAIDMRDNWVWLEDENVTWIRTAAVAQTIAHTASIGNHIHHGYTPNELTDAGYIILGDEEHHQIVASDKVLAFCSPMGVFKDHTVGGSVPWADEVVRQNKWNPMEILLSEDITNTTQIAIQIGYNSTYLWSVMKIEGHSSTKHNVALTITIPTLYYWKVTALSGSTDQIGLIVSYK